MTAELTRWHKRHLRELARDPDSLERWRRGQRGLIEWTERNRCTAEAEQVQEQHAAEVAFVEQIHLEDEKERLLMSESSKHEVHIQPYKTGYDYASDQIYQQICEGMTPRDIEFCKAYLLADTNQTRALLMVQPTMSDDVARNISGRLMKKVAVKALVHYLPQIEDPDEHKPLTFDDVIRRFTVMFRTTSDVKTLIIAAEFLFKYTELDPGKSPGPDPFDLREELRRFRADEEDEDDT